MKPDFEWEGDAREFCESRSLKGGAAVAMELIGKYFVAPEECVVTHEYDPEDCDPDSEKLLFSFAVRTDVDRTLKGYDECIDEWVRLAHPHEMRSICFAFSFKE